MPATPFPMDDLGPEPADATSFALQLRAARSLLGWRQSDLAAASGVSEMAIKNVERRVTDPRSSTVLALRLALRRAGVAFIERGEASAPGGPGVRLAD